MEKKEICTNENNLCKEGINALSEILSKFQELYTKKESDDFTPYFIFRGVETPTYEYEYGKLRIKSGATIRLISLYSDFHYAQYIDYVKSLIENAKSRFPQAYEKRYDLEILADLQHNGAATCLVDFSKNILIAIWHACQNSTRIKIETKENENINGFDKEDGILYCYNIMPDIFYQNNLKSINTKDIKSPIEDLLKSTQKAYTIQGKTKCDFWVWEPYFFNKRISRQESVFIFGLEKFVVSEHTIDIIRIKKNDKKALLWILKQLFDISETTVYCDENGFANSQSKFKRLTEEDEVYNPYKKGLNKFLIGDYKIALEYFHQCKEKQSNIKLYEVNLNYVKAMCYSKLRNNENALFYIKKCSSICYEILTRHEKEYHESLIYVRDLCMNIYSKELRVLYSMNMFLECIPICDKISQISQINDNNNKHSIRRTNLYCNLIKIENHILNLIINPNDNISISFLKEEKRKHAEEEFKDCEFLRTFFCCFFDLLTGVQKKEIYEDAICKLENIFKELDPISTPWDFDDLKRKSKIIKNQDKDGETKPTYLMQLIKYIEDKYDILNNQYLRDHSYIYNHEDNNISINS